MEFSCHAEKKMEKKETHGLTSKPSLSSYESIFLLLWFSVLSAILSLPSRCLRVQALGAFVISLVPCLLRVWACGWTCGLPALRTSNVFKNGPAL